MAIQSKINRDGIDVVIEQLQQSTFPRLLGFWDGATTYISYPRANKVYKNDNIIPEVSLDKKDYREVLYDDKVFVTSFFIVDDTRIYNDETRQFKHTISMIFQADLVKLYGNTNRADEEFNMDVIRVLKKENLYIVGDITLADGVDSVYSDLSITGTLKDKLKLTDMSQRHLLRVTFDVLYRDDCDKPILLVCPQVGTPVSTDFNGTPTAVQTPDGSTLAINVVNASGGAPLGVLVTDLALEKKIEVTFPAGVSTSPLATGVEQSFTTGDDGDRFLAGQYASKQVNDLSDYYTLVNDNEFGHKKRLYGRTGGFLDEGDPTPGGAFKDKDGNPTTKALAFPNNILRDKAWENEWFTIRGGTRNWADACNLAQTDVKGGEDGWNLPSKAEYDSITSNNFKSLGYLDTRIWIYNVNMWSGTTHYVNGVPSTSAHRLTPTTDGWTTATKTQANGTGYVKPF